MKDFLTLLDYSKAQIEELLDLADKLKYENKHNITHHLLKGQSLGMIFQKSSTRTRVSFEVGMYQLGGNALFLSPKDLQIGRGESIEDTAHVLERFLDGVMIRTFDQSEVIDFAKYSKIPVINGLTNYCHPCQVLADLQTIREYKKTLEGLKLCYIGDGNNMANSYIAGCLKTGMSVAVACPKGYEPHEDFLNFANDYKGKFLLTDNIEEAATGSDVLATDVWASMGQETQAEERKKIFKDYQINSKVMSFANADAMVIHCLPAHKGEEITKEVFDQNQKYIFEEAENRLHAQKAIMVTLMA